MTVRVHTDFGSYEVRDPEVIATDRGPCLRGEYRLIGEEQWQGLGDFPLANASVEPQLPEAA